MQSSCWNLLQRHNPPNLEVSLMRAKVRWWLMRHRRVTSGSSQGGRATGAGHTRGRLTSQGPK
jgi:hypothetical protein